jgi:transposase-like protein
MINSGEVLSLYAQGLSVTAISSATSISHYKISKLLRSEGVLKEKRVHAPKVNQKDILRAKEMLDSGCSLTDIAEKMRRSISGVSLMLSRSGVRKPRKVAPNVTELDAEEMASLSRQGFSAAQIAQKVGRSKAGVLLALERCGHYQPTPKNTVSADQKQKILAMYLDGYGEVPISKTLKVDRSYCHDIIVKAGIQQKHSRRCAIDGKRYTLNDAAFSTGEDGSYTPEQSYWAGFLLTDGSVSRQGSVKLAITDLDHVEKFQSFLGAGQYSIYKNLAGEMRSPRNGKTYKTKPVFEINLRSVKVCIDLARLGVVPDKTYTAQIPPSLSLSKDFWRGVIDGDGWMSTSFKSTNKTCCEIGVCGTVEVCQGFAEFVRHYFNHEIKIGVRKDARNFARARITGPIGEAVIHFLYSNAKISLTRKSIKAAHLLALANSSLCI